MSMTINSIANTQMTYKTTQLSTGKRINSAASDAAGLAISKKLESQIRELDQGINNAYYTKDMNNVAEGGMSGISDMLGRMRELAVSAKNSTLSNHDRSLIQTEIEQLKQGIGDIAQNTEYNTIKLLDGSANGSGSSTNYQSTTPESLGINDFDVTKDFSIGHLDKALDIIGQSQAAVGAQSNRLDYSIRADEIASINQRISQSRIQDADMARAVTDYHRDNAIEQYKMHMQKKNMNMQGNLLSLMM